MAHLNLAIVLTKATKKYESAIQEIKISLQYNPACVKALVLLAQLYVEISSAQQFNQSPKRKEQRGRDFYSKATVLFTKAIHLDPKNAELYLQRGKILLKQNYIQLASQDLNAAFQVNSFNMKNDIQVNYLS